MRFRSDMHQGVGLVRNWGEAEHAERVALHLPVVVRGAAGRGRILELGAGTEIRVLRGRVARTASEPERARSRN